MEIVGAINNEIQKEGAMETNWGFYGAIEIRRKAFRKQHNIEVNNLRGNSNRHGNFKKQ